MCVLTPGRSEIPSQCVNLFREISGREQVVALGVCLGGDLILDALNYRMRSGSEWLGLRWRLDCGVFCAWIVGGLPLLIFRWVSLHSFTHGMASR